MKKHRNTGKMLYILLSLLVFSLAVAWTDGVLHPPYFAKIAVKIVFFLVLPLGFLGIWREELPEFRKLFRFAPRGMLPALILGAVLWGTIAGGYFLVRGVFDFSAVTENLTAGMGITRETFPWAAVYITVVNSFLEEFFFRGFGFVTLKKYAGRKTAFWVSPVLFALYHGGMTAGSYPPVLLGLMLAGLTAGGMIFNRLNEKFGSLYPSWAVHVGADAGIMTVGAVLFGIL